MACRSDSAKRRNSIQCCDAISRYVTVNTGLDVAQDDIVLFYGNPGGVPTEHGRVTTRKMKPPRGKPQGIDPQQNERVT